MCTLWCQFSSKDLFGHTFRRTYTLFLMCHFCVETGHAWCPLDGSYITLCSEFNSSENFILAKSEIGPHHAMMSVFTFSYIYPSANTAVSHMQLFPKRCLPKVFQRTSPSCYSHYHHHIANITILNRCWQCMLLELSKSSLK